MKLTDRQLIGLPVVTVSGQAVGKIVGFEWESEHHLILNYHVSPNPLVTRWLGMRNSVLIVGRRQVVSVDVERMVVEDAVVHDASSVTEKITSSPQPAQITPSLFEE